MWRGSFGLATALLEQHMIVDSEDTLVCVSVKNGTERSKNCTQCTLLWTYDCGASAVLLHWEPATACSHSEGSGVHALVQLCLMALFAIGIDMQQTKP